MIFYLVSKLIQGEHYLTFVAIWNMMKIRSDKEDRPKGQNACGEHASCPRFNLQGGITVNGGDAGNLQKYHSHRNLERQAEYLFPKVLEALKNQTRRHILELLVQAPESKLSFSEIKAASPDLKNASLAYHLRVLQMADMVARTVRLEDRRQNPDPYYCFYNITRFGEHITQSFQTEVKKGIALTVSGAI